ncbi:septation ring formation regulator [Breznakia blatticola]|uniref:Septation ring formation regulator n=2 Tax=Breznakia blatticola TaxID=1754012 RepID=A0A4R7ZBI8_9FIRM|nr:septation ring formation regulator [Breznakia blatticola]
MENFINFFKQNVSIMGILIVGIILIAFIIIILIVRSIRLKRAKKDFDALELRFTELKGIPLSFKLNKAVSLSKVNTNLKDDVVSFQEEYEKTQEGLKEYSVLLAETDDFIFSKKIKKANQCINQLEPVVANTSRIVLALDAKLEKVLEQENTQRESINTLKERFRVLKRELMEHRSDYHTSIENLDSSIKNIEEMFSIFEEWMFASEFDKAADKQMEIQVEIENLEHALHALPDYYQQLKGTLTAATDELTYLYSSSKAKGVYLDHLDIDKRLEVIRELLSESLAKLSDVDLPTIEKDIDDLEVRIVSVKEDIDKENDAYVQLHEKVSPLFERVKDLNKRYEIIRELYDRVNVRFGFDNWTARLEKDEVMLDELNEQRFRLEKVISENTVPFSTLFLSYEELDTMVQKLEIECKEMQQRLESACSDEERAKEQMIKLQLIVNEIRIKIEKNHLPNVSEKYDDDLIMANKHIEDIKAILLITPLNVEALNAKIEESIDYIYTLYNSVNNLVGMAIMVENAILFGNKYRSEYAEVDNELTRAELCFNNGQYTKSLKIAMNIIEKLHPGVYENLVKKGVDINEAIQI